MCEHLHSFCYKITYYKQIQKAVSGIDIGHRTSLADSYSMLYNRAVAARGARQRAVARAEVAARAVARAEVAATAMVVVVASEGPAAPGGE